MKMESLYEKYHLKPVINASGKMTILGVSKYVDEAIHAQQFGGKNFFEMSQLEEKVGAYVADLIGTEAAHIVSSASAGIALSVAAVIGKGDSYHTHHPYSERFKTRKIVLPKGHNVDYGAPVETMIQLGGGEVSKRAMRMSVPKKRWLTQLRMKQPLSSTLRATMRFKKTC